MDRFEALKKAFVIRKTETKLLDFFQRGELHGTIHTCLGQEMTGVMLAPYLTKEDFVFSNHRCHGHYLSITNDVEGLIGEIMGFEIGCCHGVGGSQHLNKGNFYSSGIQGGMAPIAAGVAWSHQQNKTQHMAVVFLGDGTLGEGVLYETMNVAALLKLPLLFVLEDNGYAQSTAQTETFIGNLKMRVEGFGLNYCEANTWEWESLSDIYAKSVKDLRGGCGPTLIHIKTYRLGAHSKGDDDRPQTEIKKYFQLDPLNQLLEAKDKMALEAQKKASEIVEAALSKVLQSKKIKKSYVKDIITRDWCDLDLPKDLNKSFTVKLNESYSDLMCDEQIIWIGEDVKDPYGGCFKVSLGLSEKYKGRVFNMPISESAIAGLATGLALNGKKCFAEFMFGDFSLLAFDQIVNHASKFLNLYKTKSLPVYFRTPMGSGKGYGATHSQNLEKHFLGVPGLTVRVMNAVLEPSLFLKYLPVDRPCLIIENKSLYSSLFINFTFPWTARVDTKTTDIQLLPGELKPELILVGHGSYAPILIEAAEKLMIDYEIPIAIMIMGQLSDYNVKTDLEFWQLSSKVVFFEEGVGYASFSSELCSQLNPYAHQVNIWSPPEEVIPSAPHLEEQFRLNIQKVIAEALEVIS